MPHSNKPQSSKNLPKLKPISYCLSAGNFGDGKSVCLWRQEGTNLSKIARFQSDTAATHFAEEFGFPLSETLAKRLRTNQNPL
jgi:hypothetical protein